jgi:hypothetical protein
MSGWLFSSLRGYRIGWLPRDLVAGLMLLAIAMPGQLATARLAGMPPQTGIYAFIAGSRQTHFETVAIGIAVDARALVDDAVDLAMGR